MNYFIDPITGQDYAYDDDAPVNLIKPGLIVAPRRPSSIAVWQDGQWHEPAPSPEALIAAVTVAIQAELDRQAKLKSYDDIVSACSYAAQEVGAPFQAEGAAFLAWRSAVWTQAYAVLADVVAGTVPMPTPAEAVAQMPTLELP